MLINFLQAREQLTKTYSKVSGQLVKTPYPLTWEFSSIEERFTTLPQLKALLVKHAALGHCALKGTIKKPLVKESRRGSTEASGATEWLVLDLDGLPDAAEMGNTTVPMTIELFLDEMGLPDVSYIVQWSASYGIENKRLRAHVFLLLDKPYAAPLIKQWLIQKNLSVPLLRDSITLTKTGNSLSWALDISACQNDKLIYIAPPVLKGIKDPMAGQDRIEFVKRKHDVVALGGIASSAKNKAESQKIVDKLREATGLPVRKAQYKMVGSQEVMLKPDESIITEMKSDRGFVYFNLNGGDSWAYYHPENAPDYILNFKGEPAYLTKELLPDYWGQLTGNADATRTSSTGVTYLAFCDRRSGAYWRGTYNKVTDTLDINQARNETQVRHFAKQHGVQIGDFIPEWDLVFDPQDMVRVDEGNRVVNLFQPSYYMLNVSDKAPKAIPPTIKKIITHALGDDPVVVAHFLNWLAVIAQTRTRTRTAWVLHGTQGTGKGLLVNEIIAPLFKGLTHKCLLGSLVERFNGYMEGKLFILVDEVQASSLTHAAAAVDAKLKNAITEATVPMRRMHATEVEVDNFTNWIFMSNKADPVQIARGDRRYNVGNYQVNKLQITSAEVDQIQNELQAFYNWLANTPADIDQAGQVLVTKDREQMIALTETAAESVAEALMGGNMQFFLDSLPTDESYKRNALVAARTEDYVSLLKTLICRTDPLNGKCNLGRDELMTLFKALVGTVPDSPNKFTAYLKHARVHIEAVWVDNKTVRGVKTVWRDYKKFPSYLSAHFTKPEPKKPAAKKAKETA